MTKKVTGLAIASLAMAFALYGCDSNGGGVTNANEPNSSNSSANNDPKSKDSDDTEGEETETIEAETLDDLPKCTSKKEGTIATVEDDGLDYYCYDSEWIGTVATKTKLPNCTAKKEGDRIYVKKSEEVFYCSEDEEWLSTNDENEPARSSSSKDDTPKEKVVEFADGVIWQPSYGRRAYTGETGIDEYNFLDEDAEGENGAGWWYKFLDNGQGGSSTAVGKFSDESLVLTFNLAYTNWEEKIWTSGDDYGYYYAPDPYPFAGFGFNLKNDQKTTDITSFSQGICITYASSTTVKIAIPSTATDLHGISYEYNLPYSTSSTTAKVLWSKFTQPSYAADQGATVARATALAKAYALQIMYSNDQSGVTDYCGGASLSTCQSYANAYGSSSFTVYKIEKYDGTTCGGSSDSDNTL